MSNRCTIDIDMDRMTAEMRTDDLACVRVGGQIETTTAALVGLCLRREVKRLMRMTKKELEAEYQQHIQEMFQ